MHRFSSLTEVQGSLCNIAARRSIVLYSKDEHDKSKVKLTVTRRHPHQHNHTSKPRDHVTQSTQRRQNPRRTSAKYSIVRLWLCAVRGSDIVKASRSIRQLSAMYRQRTPSLLQPYLSAPLPTTARRQQPRRTDSAMLFFQFLPRDATQSAVLQRQVVCPSLSLSVRDVEVS